MGLADPVTEGRNVKTDILRGFPKMEHTLRSKDCMQTGSLVGSRLIMFVQGREEIPSTKYGLWTVGFDGHLSKGSALKSKKKEEKEDFYKCFVDLLHGSLPRRTGCKSVVD